MVDMHREDKIIRTPIFYKHVMNVTYPKDNVVKMVDSWKSVVTMAEDFLSKLDGMYDKALEDGYARIDNEVKVQKETIAAKLAKTPEELKEELYTAFLGEVKKMQEEWEKVDEVKKDFETKLKDQLDKQRQRYQTEKNEKLEALKLWENPTDE
jgi:hypothetical protein